MAALIMTFVLILTLLTPYIVYVGIKAAKNKDFPKHRKIQNLIFVVCIVGLIGFEGLIKVSGGSGSLSSQSSYADSSVFKIILFSHIIGAMITYLVWCVQILMSNLRYKKSLPGKSAKSHRFIGMFIFLGLVYTAVTALIVYVMTLDLI